MARPLWKGYLSFGLVTMPCALSPFEKPESEIDFVMLDRRDQSRIRYVRVSERTGKEVQWKEIVKGHEVGENKYVIVTPDDLKKAAPKATRTINIMGFVDRAEIPPWYYERPYVIQPLAEGEKGYRLLCAALQESEQIGIATIVLHTRQHLAALIPNGPALMLNTMRFDEELRHLKDFDLPAASASKAKAVPREVEMAQTLIKTMTVGWKPEQYHDEYREVLRKWIAQRAKKGSQVAPPVEEEEEVPGPYNIMDMLKKSIEGQKRPRAASGRRSVPHRKAG